MKKQTSSSKHLLDLWGSAAVTLLLMLCNLATCCAVVNGWNFAVQQSASGCPELFQLVDLLSVWIGRSIGLGLDTLPSLLLTERSMVIVMLPGLGWAG